MPRPSYNRGRVITADKARGCLLGLAVGDAIGTTVEFQPRGSFEPVTDMTGGGPFRLRAGQWTDDTSMALCLAASLIDCRRFDARDQMERYLRWLDHGYMSSTGKCFDMGRTVKSALRRFRETGNPFAGSTDPQSAGNGCIMRLAPVPIFWADNVFRAAHFAEESARTTHGATECREAARLFAGIIVRALSGASKDDVLMGDADLPSAPAKVLALARGDYRRKPRAAIKGSGYVIDSLEAALWCFATTTSFSDAVLTAANLGDDADTTAAVCGQLAGAFYGESGIPAAWLEKLAWRTEIADMADRLRETANADA